MKLVAAVAVLWIVGAFVTCVFVAGATRRGASDRARKPEPPAEDLELDLLAATDLALEQVYGPQDPGAVEVRDLVAGGDLVRQVVRARPGQRPRPAGLR